MQKDSRKKDRGYQAAMLLKYWKVTVKEPIMDLCMIIVMYTQDFEAGLLYAVGSMVTLTMDRIEAFKDINTLLGVSLKSKDDKETLVKNVMNGSDELHAFLFENGTVRVVEEDKSTFDISLESEIIKINSGNYCNSLFIVDKKMRGYEIKNRTPIRVTGLPDTIKIKDISCGDGFTMFLSECGRVFGTGPNEDGILGLPRRIEKTDIPTEIPLSNQSDLNKNEIMIAIIHAGPDGWVGAVYTQ